MRHERSSWANMVAMRGGAHLPGSEEIERWPSFSHREPLRVLVSACLAGVSCGVDGTSYGAPYLHLSWLFTRSDVSPITFCPEDFAFGTPRRIPDIHGGDGFDVLDGRATVRSDAGEDWTTGMVEAAEEMLRRAQEADVRLAVLTDISAACGSQVIYLGQRSGGLHQAGQGVAAALLLRNGIAVVSHRDHKTLGRIVARLDPAMATDADAQDHHETEWYLRRFGKN